MSTSIRYTWTLVSNMGDVMEAGDVRAPSNEEAAPLGAEAAGMGLVDRQTDETWTLTVFRPAKPAPMGRRIEYDDERNYPVSWQPAVTRENGEQA